MGGGRLRTKKLQGFQSKLKVVMLKKSAVSRPTDILLLQKISKMLIHFMKILAFELYENEVNLPIQFQIVS